MRARGFSFIELIITLGIMATLVLVAVPLAQLSVRRHQEQELRASLIEIRESIDAYKRAADQGRIQVKIGESGYPRSLEELYEGVPDQKSPSRQKLYFIRRLPRDPFCPDQYSEVAECWGKRSYDSPPDDPSEGDDVFDVYSSSDLVGLNGVAYREW